ncbi:MAG: PAS domain S-box protein, partial [Chloroflexota bacterium]
GKVHWSKDVEALFGLPPGQFAGTYEAYLDLLSDEDEARVRRAIQEALQHPHRQYHVIHTVRMPGGEERWLEGRANVQRDDSGRPIRMTGTVADITSRVEAEGERAQLLGKMEKRNAHLNAATRVSKFCNIILDPDLLIQQATDLIAEGFDMYYVGLFLVKDGKAFLKAGYGEAGRAMVNKGFFLPVDEHSMIGWSIVNQRARIAQHALNDEVRRVNPQLPDTRSEMAIPLVSRGRVIGAFTVQSAMENAFDEGDIAILQTLSDQIAVSIENARLFSELQNELQHRLKVELELERERDFAVLVMSTLGQGVIVTDEEARLEYANPAFARMIGLPQEQILGRKTEEFIHAEDRDKLENWRSERKTSSFEARFLRANGQVAHVLVTSSPRNAKDRSLGAIAAMIDLTERKQAELERESLIRELEGKNAELERFTYTVSHDLKSPLITIRGFLGYLLSDAEKGDLARMRDDAKRITEATNRMQRLLDDLLELSRVGRLMNPPEEVPFAQIVREAMALVEGRIIQGKINVRISPRLPVVHVDRVRMVEAVQNLLDNAAKFMGDQPNPWIEIGIREDSGQTVLFVKDNGIGIEPKYQPKIFGLFNKLDPSTEGTGVGLALVKRIIEVHGGKIWLESSPGQGSAFYFTLGQPPA